MNAHEASKMITPGARIGDFTVLSVDPTGKRVAVSCLCRAVHVFSSEALLSGAAMCHAVPLTPAQREALRIEAAERERQREQRRWRPGDVTEGEGALKKSGAVLRLGIKPAKTLKADDE